MSNGPIASAGDLRTPRLDLAALRVGDAADMVRVLADPALYAFTGGSPPTLDELRQRYESQVAGSGDVKALWHNWILRTRTGGVAIGFVQATVDLGPDRVADLAWLIGVDHQHRGFALEGARAMLDGLRSTGVDTFTAHIHPAHAASQNVARSLGFVETSDRDDDGEAIWTWSATDEPLDRHRR